jgi:integrase
LVEHRVSTYGKLLPCSDKDFRNQMDELLTQLGIPGDPKHTPHDCRHTFSMLCEKYEVKENDRKRMMGHSFKEDITNKVYGHRELEDLRKEIEKIEINL